MPGREALQRRQPALIAPFNPLTQNGVLDPPRLYKAPFADLHVGGPEGLFDEAGIEALFGIIEEINAVAG